MKLISTIGRVVDGTESDPGNCKVLSSKVSQKEIVEDITLMKKRSSQMRRMTIAEKASPGTSLPAEVFKKSSTLKLE